MQFIQRTKVTGLECIDNRKECVRDTQHDQYPILSNAFFCTNCGSIWARIVRCNKDKQFDWEIIHTQCLECSKNNSIPARLNVSGSVWNPFLDIRQLDYLPVEVIKMELDLLLALEETKYD